MKSPHPHWMSEMVETPVGGLHVWRVGYYLPPVVMAHAYLDDGACWEPLAEALRDRYTSFLPSARGHGQSARISGPYGEAERASDLLTIIDRLVGGAVAGIGHSMGAAAILSAAARQPGRFTCLVLIDPPFYAGDDPGLYSPENISAYFQWVLRLREMPADRALSLARKRWPRWHEAAYAPWLAAKHDIDPALDAHLQRDRAPWRETLARIQCPVLILAGEPQRGAIITPATTAEIRLRYPHVQVVALPAGHDIQRERPQETARIIAQFLADF